MAGTAGAVATRRRPGRARSLRAALAQAFPTVAADELELPKRRRSARAGDLVCRAGEPADEAWLVVRGRLRAVRGTGATATILGDVGPGEIVGEAALLDSGVRQATLIAARDTDVAVLDRAWLAAAVARSPAVLGALLASLRDRPAVDRLDERLVALVATPGTEAEVAAVVERLQAMPGTAVVLAGGADLDDEGVVAALEADHRRAVLVAGPEDDAWSERCRRLADHVAVFVDVADAHRRHPAEEPTAHPVVQSRTTVLVHPPGTAAPTGTSGLLQHRPGVAHLHLRRGDDAHRDRVTRLLCRTGIALVLSGGGARALAEIGAYAELRRRGVPVDAAVGTSAGAVLAAGIATGAEPDELLERAGPGFVDVRDPTVPFVSLLKGERLWDGLTAGFGTVDIEDLWLPFGCVSTDLTVGDAAWHTQGELRLALRASVALPGVFPPVGIDGHLHVDGGLLDNVPVDLAARVAPGATRIVVDVSPAHGPAADPEAPASVSGARLLLDRLRRRRPLPLPLPSLTATIGQSLILAGAANRNRARELADLHLDLPMEDFGLLEFGKLDRIVAAGAERSAAPIDRFLAQTEIDLVTLIAPDPAAPPPPPPDPTPLEATEGRAVLGAVWLAVADLRFRLRRFVVAVAAASVTLMLLLLMTGVVNQFDREPGATIDTLGGSHWVLRDGIESPFASDAVFAPGLADQVVAPEGGTARTLVVASLPIAVDGDTREAILIGHPADGPGTPVPVEGRLATDGSGVAVSTAAGVEVGERVLVGGSEREVVGTVADSTLYAGMPLVFVPIEQAWERLSGGAPFASAVLLEGEPASVPEGLHVRTADEVATAAKGPLERPILTLHLVRGLLAIVAAMIIGAVVYLASIERTRDVAVLRAVGVRSPMLAVGVAVQALAMAVVAAIIGIGLQELAAPAFPMAVHLTATDLLVLIATAAVVAMVASYAAIRRTLRIDPSAAFAGAGG